MLALVAPGIACGSARPPSDDQTGTTTGVPSYVFDDVRELDFTSVEEAANVAQFDIPQPSAAYPMATGKTHLRFLPQFERPVSETQYAYVPLFPTSFTVNVGPSYFWRGDETWTSGMPTQIGGLEGWMSEDGFVRDFAYKCGAIDSVTVWCVVRAPLKIAKPDFEAFVDTLG
jgi:hypothetical protein